MKAPVDVSAIIISLNSKRFLRDCLETLERGPWRDVTREIIVADNGSTDGTLELLRESYPSVQVLAIGKNIGFCPAGNLAARKAAGRYLLFLNDDILVQDDAIPRLVEWMDAHPEAGMIGSRLLNIDGTDQFSSGRRFPGPMNALFGRKSVLTRLFPKARWARRYLLSDRVNSAEPYLVDWISAAAMLVRRPAFFESGGLAEDFYYFHEMVICSRCRKAGYTVWLHPQSKIIHYEGAGSGLRTRRVRRRHIGRFHRAAYRWYCLHHGLGRWNPRRYVAAAILAVRAVALIVVDSLKPGPRSEGGDDRPEGGVAM
ncbi:MAG: glycosyltransferase family 2 protein [Bryobacteraceae bacterium]|jgi:GT2 family glycosyltransferase